MTQTPPSLPLTPFRVTPPLAQLLTVNEVRLKVCCVAGTHTISSQADLEAHKSAFSRRLKVAAMERKASAKNVGSFSEAHVPPRTPKTPGAFFGEDAEEGVKVNLEQLLFEVESDDFGDILAELKATHTSLRALLGGVGASSSSSSSASMIRSVFDAVDSDGSGMIDKYELQACIEKFNVEHDPKFFKYVLREEGIREDDELNFDQFERFLIRFLQHQVLSHPIDLSLPRILTACVFTAPSVLQEDRVSRDEQEFVPEPRRASGEFQPPRDHRREHLETLHCPILFLRPKR